MATFFSKFGIILLLSTLSEIRSQWIFDDESCTTPDRRTGTCIIVNDCKPILDLLDPSRPLPPAVVTVLQSYRCGFEGSSVKVCCPPGPISIGGTTARPPVVNPPPTTRPVRGDPQPPDVTNHRNMNLLPSTCGPYSIDDKLLNGNKTALFEFPWMVLISYQTSNGPDFRCGGTLINSRYVLTAAHCIATNLKILGVRLGEHDTRTPVDCQSNEELGGDPECAAPHQDITIEEVIPHPSWNTPAYSNDIGLIRLSTPADISVDSVRPICLPVNAVTRQYDFFNGNKVTVTGWGSTETARNSPDLLKVSIPIIPHQTCVQLYQKSGVNITYQQVCAGGVNNTDSCSGDSGGPMQVVLSVNNRARYVQLGIVSFGPKLCGTNPGVYTKVAYYMDWILDTLKP